MKPVISKFHTSHKTMYDTIELINKEMEKLIIDIDTQISQFKINQNLHFTYKIKTTEWKHPLDLKFTPFGIIFGKSLEGKWMDVWTSKYKDIKSLNIIYKGNRWVENGKS